MNICNQYIFVVCICILYIIFQEGYDQDMSFSLHVFG